MELDKELYEKLPEDNDLAILHIWNEIQKVFTKGKIQGDSARMHEVYLEAWAFMLLFAKKRDLRLDLGDPAFTQKKDIDRFHGILQGLLNKANERLADKRLRQKFDEALQHYSAIQGESHLEFTFEDSDFTRLQKLINEIRGLLQQSNEIPQGHKSRLLSRLERLQGALHKTMSNLESIWVFVGDAGVYLGKFGTDIKPLMDRVREIMDIVAKAAYIANGLGYGDGQLLLPPPKIGLPSEEPNSKSDAI